MSEKVQGIVVIAVLAVLGLGFLGYRRIVGGPNATRKLPHLPDDVIDAIAKRQADAGATPDPGKEKSSVGVSKAPEKPAVDLGKPDVGVTSGLAINVYIDGSGSIEHFLHLPAKDTAGQNVGVAPGTNYLAALLDSMGRDIQSVPGWQSKDAIKFWRFGGKDPVEIGINGLAEMAKSPSRITFPENTTMIEVPFSTRVGTEEKPIPELKIVVTDLFETNDKNLSLAQAIAQKYLLSSSKEKGAIGILAIRNPYYGSVEDFPGNETGKLVATSMPIYVLVAGPLQDVRYAVKALLNRLGLVTAFTDSKAQLLFFLPESDRLMLNQPEPEQAADLSVKGKPKQSFHLMDDDYQGSKVPLYNLGKGKVILLWNDVRSDDFLFADSKQFVWQQEWTIPPTLVDSLRFKVTSYGGDGTGEVDDAGLAEQCVREGYICMSVDGMQLIPGKNYLFEVDTLEESSDFAVDPKPLSRWAINEQDAKRLSRPPGEGFHRQAGVDDSKPGLTPNLQTFLNALQGHLFPDGKTSTANHHYVYIHAQ